MGSEARGDGIVGMRVAMGPEAVTANARLGIQVGATATTEIEGLGTGEVVIVESANPHVRLYQWRILAGLIMVQKQRAANAWRNRAVMPRWKQRRRRASSNQPPPGMRLCPECLNDPERVIWCDVCDSRGLVSIEHEIDA